MKAKKEFPIKTFPEFHGTPCRDLPGWPSAPLPPCKNGDVKGLVWCCRIDKGGTCRRDEYLKKIGMSPKKFIEIKDAFSKKEDWDSEIVCWKSLSYCCMGFGHTCPLRDKAIQERYPEKKLEDALKEYFSKKKELAGILMKNAKKTWI